MFTAVSVNCSSLKWPENHWWLSREQLWLVLPLHWLVHPRRSELHHVVFSMCLPPCLLFQKSDYGSILATVRSPQTECGRVNMATTDKENALRSWLVSSGKRRRPQERWRSWRKAERTMGAPPVSADKWGDTWNECWAKRLQKGAGLQEPSIPDTRLNQIHLGI